MGCAASRPQTPRSAYNGVEKPLPNNGGIDNANYIIDQTADLVDKFIDSIDDVLSPKRNAPQVRFTATELQYLRRLFLNHCPDEGGTISLHSLESIMLEIGDLPVGGHLSEPSVRHLLSTTAPEARRSA